MFQKLLEKIALALDRLGIAYMLIGGQAVFLYGEPRLTRDIDVVIDAGPDHLSGFHHSPGYKLGQLFTG